MGIQYNSTVSIYQLRIQISVQSIKSGDLYQGRRRYHKGHQYSVDIMAAITFVEGEWYVIRQSRSNRSADFANDHLTTSIWMFVERIKTMRKKTNHGERKTTQTIKQCSKTMVDMEEKNTYIYLTIAYITWKTVVLLADIAIFNCVFGRIII